MLDLRFQPRRFAGGLANLNFLVLINGTWAVLRRPPSGPLPPGAHDMEREHKILSRLWQVLSLAPRSLHLCDDVSVGGTPFHILEFRPGLIIRGDELTGLPPNPETSRRLAEVLVDTLVRIHSVDMTAISLHNLGRPDAFVERTSRRWIERARLAGTKSASRSIGTVAEWLQVKAAGICGDVTLLHNDFKLDNVVLDPASLAAVGVLDWDMGTRGDPLFDLATLLSYWTEPGDPPCMHRLAQMPTARPGFPSREAVAGAYAKRTGRSLSTFQVYRVLTVFKLGVVFHQLHALYRAGRTNDSRYSQFGSLADEILEFAVDIANGRAF
jgi:aminoglycoside phosphotransferase (APT) family kinase protein